MNSHTVLFFGPLRDEFETKSMELEMPTNCSVDDVLTRLGVTKNLVKTAVNGEIVPTSTRLRVASEIALLPPVSGG
jgi:molybdopterin converting factor small subunit